MPTYRLLQKKPLLSETPLAEHYQSLLNAGIVKNRAALARFSGVSRARVTQVLNRLKQADPGETDASSKGAAQ